MKTRNTIILIFILLILITFITKYYGSIDIGDYADSAKFFAGKFSADIRTSHSLSYGLLISPLLIFSNNFSLLKLISLLSIILIVLSVYYISGKKCSALLLMLASPVVWYMSPWISPIPLAALFLLWGVFFIEKYSETEKKSYLAYSGIFVGLAWVFWNTILFLLPFFLICFFYKKNVNHLVLFLFFILIGLIPLFLTDYIFYGFPFYSLIKNFIGNLVVMSSGGIYGEGGSAGIPLIGYILFILLVPIFSYKLFSQRGYKLRTSTFLFGSFLVFLSAPQIRYLLLLYPLIILGIVDKLEKKQIHIQIVIFVILNILIISPYLIQINYSTDSPEFNSFIGNFGKWEISRVSNEQLMIEDMTEIAGEYPNSTFLVGNEPDSYQILAHLYWEEDIKEFVSIQDYNLVMENKTILFEKKFMPIPKIPDRRQIWFAGGISRNENDKTDYKAIKLAIGINAPINIPNSTIIRKYNLLYLSKIS